MDFSRAPTLNEYQEPHVKGDAGDQMPHVAAVTSKGIDIYNQQETGDVAHTLRVSTDNGLQSSPHVQQAMAVRRLTPVECERLQGFPEVRESCIFEVCSDHPRSGAPVDQKCPRSPSNASHAEGSESSPDVKSAVASLADDHQSLPAPVAVSVLIDCEREPRLQLRIGRWSSFASSADVSAACRRLTLPDDFARVVALMLHGLDREVTHGRAASHQSNGPSGQAWNGRPAVAGCGPESGVDASAVEQSINDLIRHSTSTTLGAGSSFPISDSTLTTLFSYVWTVIGSFIPAETRSASSFACALTVSSGYTRIPWRGKPAEDCPDGPRYRAIGNSMAVPVMHWIGRQIDAAQMGTAAVGAFLIQQGGAL